MIIEYLGTAAAEGMPAVFCRCKLCNLAREKGGKNIRTRNQILIDGDTLIDFPMDTYMHALTRGLDLSAISDVFITHAHMDHCYPQDLTMHGAPFAHNMTLPVINIYGNKAVTDKFYAHTKDEIKPDVAKSIKLHTVAPYDTIVTDSGKTVTALPAKHTVGEDCLLYSVTANGKSILIMNDTGILDESVYVWLSRAGFVFDLVSFDCTYCGIGHGPGRHMGLPDNIAERERMKMHKLVNKNTKYIATHFSHNNALLHEDMNNLAKESGMIAAYDGMKIEL